MNWLRSFRWLILLGAFVWSLGLIPLGYFVFQFVHRKPFRLPYPARVNPEITLAFVVVCMVAGILLMRAGLSQPPAHTVVPRA